MEDLATKYNLDVSILSDALDIFAIGGDGENLGPGGIDDATIDAFFVADYFLRGVEYGYTQAKREGLTAHARGVADAWSDVRRRLRR